MTVASLGSAGAFLSEIAPILERVDVTDLDAVQRAIDEVDPDVVVNCVGVVKQRPSAKDSITSITVNALFPHQLASDVCRVGPAADPLLDRLCVLGTPRFLHRGGRVGRRGPVRPHEVSRRGGRRGTDVAHVDHRAGALHIPIARRVVHCSETAEPFRALSVPCTAVSRPCMLRAPSAESSTSYPDLSGLYQLAGPVISKYDLLCEIRDAMDLDISIVPNSEFVLDRTLVGDRFVAETGLEAPSWADMITDMANDPTPYEEMR